MRLTIGISPCPNDTFIFEALHDNLIDTGDLQFDFIFEDVETLNQMATAGKADLIKISYAHFFTLDEQYAMCRSGGAMGYGVGPLLISARPPAEIDLQKSVVAIPGVHTTAHFLLRYAYPFLTQIHTMRFDLIENAVLSGAADAGLIIHENRFTYAARGLHKIVDLGEYWEEHTQLPIPLGGIAIRRALPNPVAKAADKLIRESILFARQRPETITNFIRMHAQEMDEHVMKKHIDLYVNSFSLDAGLAGENALQKMKALLNVKTQHAIFIPNL